MANFIKSGNKNSTLNLDLVESFRPDSNPNRIEFFMSGGTSCYWYFESTGQRDTALTNIETHITVNTIAST